MKKLFIGISLFTYSLLASNFSLAADSDGNYAVWGEGGASCYSFSKARAAEKDAPFKAYLRGYLTSYNTITDDTYSISGGMKLTEMMEWLDNYCDQKAIDSFDRAIQMMISSIEDKRYKKPKKKGISGGWGN